MKKRKALSALLVAFAATCVCAGFSACKKDKGSNDSEIYRVYQSYVASAEASGEEPLSYEDWLASIKGEKGDKGDPGEIGIGIVSITLAEDRKSYIVKYSDGSSEAIPVPEALPEQEHGHVWGDKIVRVVEPSILVWLDIESRRLRLQRMYQRRLRRKKNRYFERFLGQYVFVGGVSPEVYRKREGRRAGSG